MTLAILNEVMALPVAEKLELIDKLWESLSLELEESDISDEEKQLLDERWEKYLKNPDSALTIEQFEALMANRRK